MVLNQKNKILLIILLNVVIILSEIIFGIISNSFALISDALHNTADVIAILVTYIALVFSLKQATFKYTFGFLRAEMMAGFVNTIFLFITMSYMIYEASIRLLNPKIIEPVYMVIVGFIALIANILSAYVLWTMRISDNSHNKEENVNIKSAYFHMLGDALISLSVVIAGIFIHFFHIYYIDSVLTIIFSIYILFQAYPLFKISFFSLMDINTTTVSKQTLDLIINENDKIVEYHDLHIYKPSSQYNFISFHIVFNDENITLKEIEDIKDTIKNKLEKEGFNHILIQVDSNKEIENHIKCSLDTHII
jgi:cobalt-zinc-cadmium efflux system protein